MEPSVPAPGDGQIRIPIEAKLALGWRYDASRGEFVSGRGDVFQPGDVLPKQTKIVYKVPALAKADSAKLSEPERELRRYIQLILPPGEAAADYYKTVDAWPCVERATVGPDVELP